MKSSNEGAAMVVALLEQAEMLLKEATLGLEFGRLGVNTSLALTAVQGLIAYLEGNKLRAAEDLSTAAEEIYARLDRDTTGRLR